MKVYNITNTRKFFQLLSQSEGEVEIINEDGLHISLNDAEAEKSLALLALSYAKGTICEMELCFSRPEDARNVIQYLTSMKGAA